ncbi:hypothetical protein KIN20_019084 [Parelaphostrongylus tenuis]|uniref:Uncharacterized protein n=1 Tax=Parelaphostrongylus tenuis TaxID=148309 RepID=A0AAD5MKV0_PARTN|nr:hypothetical protein KIN20_019084 [Parelaphostrongylus tenuis]
MSHCISVFLYFVTVLIQLPCLPQFTSKSHLFYQIRSTCSAILGRIDISFQASDALAFDRDRDAFEPPKLLPANVLLRKLADKAQHSFRGDETDVHPDDRKNDDNYVNEVPDVNEKDYKENEQL